MRLTLKASSLSSSFQPSHEVLRVLCVFFCYIHRTLPQQSGRESPHLAPVLLLAFTFPPESRKASTAASSPSAAALRAMWAWASRGRWENLRTRV